MSVLLCAPAIGSVFVFPKFLNLNFGDIFTVLKYYDYSLPCEPLEVVVLNFTWWCIVTTFRTDDFPNFGAILTCQTGSYLGFPTLKVSYYCILLFVFVHDFIWKHLKFSHFQSPLIPLKSFKDSQKTPHTSPSRVSYGVSLWIVLHIDTADITGIDICPPILISILWYPSHRYISMSCFTSFVQSILQENTANTLWFARIIIPILNITLSTLNPMVIFTCSPHFPNILGVMPFVRRILLKVAQI